MRCLAAILLLLITLPAAAAEESETTLSLDLEKIFEMPPPELVFNGDDVLRITPQEFRLVLWNAPMGRMQYELARQRAMFGREGLVHGHRPIGIGLEGAALGAGPSGMGLNGLLNGGARWSEMSLGERAQAGIEVGISLGILAAIFSGLN